MRKILATILALVYLSSSIGATVQLHFCMGKFSEWRLGTKELKVCPVCGMEKKQTDGSGCCRDEKKFIKNTSDQRLVDLAFSVSAMDAAVAAPFYDVTWFVRPVTIIADKPISTGPPLSSQFPVYLLNRTLLI